MSVVIINPNATEAMTNAMLAVAQEAEPEIQFEGWTSHLGPPSIQGREDGDAATAPLLTLVDRAVAQNAQGIIIGCFDDTALAQAAKRAPCPVLGIGQAAYHAAALRSWRFSVVTTLSVSVPILEENIRALGLAGYLGRVRASEVPVLELEDNPAQAARAVRDEAVRAQAEDKVDAVILGCAGMVQVMQEVRAALRLPVIDPVTSAVSSMAMLVKEQARYSA